jgi:hypothetical protein
MIADPKKQPDFHFSPIRIHLPAGSQILTETRRILSITLSHNGPEGNAMPPAVAEGLGETLAVSAFSNARRVLRRINAG